MDGFLARLAAGDPAAGAVGAAPSPSVLPVVVETKVTTAPTGRFKAASLRRRCTGGILPAVDVPFPDPVFGTDPVEFMSSRESPLGGGTPPGAEAAKWARLSRSESSTEVLGMPVD